MKIGSLVNDFSNFANKNFENIEILDLQSPIKLDYKISHILFKELENEQYDIKM